MTMEQEIHAGLCNDPLKVYPDVKGIDYKDFQIPEKGMTRKQVEKALVIMFKYEKERKKNFLGYQANQNLNYSKDLGVYLDFHINNIGEPCKSGNCNLNSKWVERAVLDYYAKLWHIDSPHLLYCKQKDPEFDRECEETKCPKDKVGNAYWGYVGTMGSTEANLYALRNARDYLAGKLLCIDPMETDKGYGKKAGRPVLKQGYFVNVNLDTKKLADEAMASPEEWQVKDENAYTPVLFYSEDTHYSIDKIKDILMIKTFKELGDEKFPGECPIADEWPEKVPSNKDGSVNIDALVKLVAFFAGKGYPPIICFNYGTTFKGAYDDVKTAVTNIINKLKEINPDLIERILEVRGRDGKIYKSIRTGFWFHVDGALGASFMPYIEKAKERGLLPPDTWAPVFDFRLNIHSIAMSGHKYPGAPWPSSVFMTRTKYLLSFSSISYIGSHDSTLSGSRNGFSAMIFWHYLANRSEEAHIAKAVDLQKNAALVYELLKDLEKELGKDLYVKRSPSSLTILFKRPNKRIVDKYSLSCQDEDDLSYAHIYIMDHVQLKTIYELINDLRQQDAFPTEYPDEIEYGGPGFK